MRGGAVVIFERERDVVPWRWVAKDGATEGRGNWKKYGEEKSGEYGDGPIDGHARRIKHHVEMANFSSFDGLMPRLNQRDGDPSSSERCSGRICPGRCDLAFTF